jgi:methyl-accepting chemotaxis protein
MPMRFRTLFKNVSLRATIAGLVVFSVLCAVAALAAGIYVSVGASFMQQGRDQALAALRTAATVFVESADGYTIKWSDDGQLGRITVWGLLPYRDNTLVQAISRVSGAETSIFTLDKDTQALIVGTTTLLGADQHPALGATLDQTGAAYAALSNGALYTTEENLDGNRYFTAYKEIVRDRDAVIVGVLRVAVPLAEVEQRLFDIMGLVLKVCVAVVLVVAGFGYVAALLITRPIPRLVATMRELVAGNYETAVPYTGRGSEIGKMADAVEIFRENGLKIAQMTAEETASSEKRRTERALMMRTLRQEIGDVVDAAVAGDFDKRVTAEFPDPELASLATGINALVESVSRGLGETTTVLAAVAEADLTRRVNGHYQGAFAQLRDSTNSLVHRLNEIVSDVQLSSRGLKTATEEILQGADDLSERTTKQAATIEETSAAIEHLSGTVSSNALQAKQASDNAREAARTAELGGQAMGTATEAMEKILASSNAISGIIGVIDDIAFQTNLLALNASVEAARAGEAGKGFAVVAIEVRRLAQSAAEASRDVKQLIEQSAEQIRIGGRLVSEAANTLESMRLAAHANNELMDNLARQSAQQAGAIEEVTSAIRQMDEMTQHNAALVEQTNAAIAQTETQARKLDSVIDTFRIGEAQPVSTASAAPPVGSRPRRSPSAIIYAVDRTAAVTKDRSAF